MSWKWKVSHLFQPLHVFEVESNVKKAEIRIYKLKLQEKEIIKVSLRGTFINVFKNQIV